jgi:hypothetical protein
MKTKLSFSRLACGVRSRSGISRFGTARFRNLVALVFVTALLSFSQLAQAQGEKKDGGFTPTPMSALSDKRFSILGVRALAMNGSAWRHAETENFILHYLSEQMARPVGLEAEFYFRFLVRELTATPEGNAKGHIYIFESPEQWRTFCGQMSLEPWTAAFTAGNELFVVRNPSQRLQGNALGHEIVHYMVHKFVPGKPPLWVNEGYAEDASRRGFAVFKRIYGRGEVLLDRGPDGEIRIAQLTAMKTYPPAERVSLFYAHSRRVVGYLNRLNDRTAFLRFLRAIALDHDLEKALEAGYGTRWLSVEDFEEDFRKSSDRLGNKD